MIKIKESTTWYKVQKKMWRHEHYLKENDVEHNIICFNNIEFRESNNIDIQKIVERNMIFNELHNIISQLDYKEKKLINCIYFSEMSINQYAKSENISYPTAWNRHKRTLDKLKRKCLHLKFF